MGDDAFAFSPMSARPILPGAADYDAIFEAFMETSRGRWFLREYARRNGNTDTLGPRCGCEDRTGAGGAATGSGSHRIPDS